MTLGAHIRRARDEAGLTQRQLSNHLGVITTTISRWERDVTEPRFDQILQIAELTGHSMSWFFSEDGETEKVA